MDWLATFANIVQVIGGIWVLFLGGKTVFDIIKQLRQDRKLHTLFSSLYVTNVLTIIILLLLIGGYLKNGSAELVPTPTPTPFPSCLDRALPLAISVSSQVHQDGVRTMTNKCKDISLRFNTELPDVGIKVQTCFPKMYPNPWCGSPPETQNGWVLFKTQGSWQAIATNVDPGTLFYLKFKLDDVSTDPIAVGVDIAY